MPKEPLEQEEYAEDDDYLYDDYLDDEDDYDDELEELAPEDSAGTESADEDGAESPGGGGDGVEPEAEQAQEQNQNQALQQQEEAEEEDEEADRDREEKADEDDDKKNDPARKFLESKIKAWATATFGPWVAGIGCGCLVLVIAVIILVTIMTTPAAGTTDTGSASNCSGGTVVIDPGHPSEQRDSTTQADYDRDEAGWNAGDESAANGGTAGKLGGKTINERVVNQQVADLLGKELEARGYKVVKLKDDSEKFLSNRKRGVMARDAKADIIIKIHNDGMGPKPGMIFYTSNKTVIKSKWNDKNELGEYISRRKDATIEEDKKLADALNKAFKDGASKYSLKYSSGGNYPSTVIPHPNNIGFGYTYDIPTSLFEMSSMDRTADLSFISNKKNQENIVKAFADGIEAYKPAGSCGKGLCFDPPKPDPSSTAGFAQLPDNPDMYTRNGGSPRSQQWGTPELVALLQGVAQEWNKRHPGLKIMYGDLSIKNGGQFGVHSSHQVGIDVDITSHTNPSFIMTDAHYDKKLAAELAKLIMDTRANVSILYNDTSIHKEVNDYANKNSLPGHIQSYDGHANHFHVRIDPSNYANACGFTESAAGKKGDQWLVGHGQDGG